MSDPLASTADAELRAHLERILSGLYDLDAELGRGGMGVVYKARDRKLKRAVAVKVLPPELGYRAEIRMRFLREAETAAQLTHPNIVPIYTVDEKDGLVYFVMGLIDGDNLAKRIHDRGAMDPTQARRILRDVADALAYAHSHKVVHRDIKPDNILLDVASGRPMVTDFGIARAISEGADARLTATGIAIGTPAYMSPEQSAGDKEIDGRTDLYSLGVVAYQMLSGELPFIAASTPAMLVKHLSEQPMPVNMRRAGIPDDLAAAVMCCLEKDPANRFPDANALIAALDGGGSIPAVRPSAPRPAPTWSPMPADEPTWPTPEELARWNAPIVDKFRRKLPLYIVVNSVILFFTLIGHGGGLLGLSAIWSVFLAFRYAKVWSEGYDWHDVFKQPHDRMLFDVIAEWFDDMRGIFDKEKRAEVRARRKLRSRKPAFMTPVSPSAAVLPQRQVERVLPASALKLNLSNAELSAIGGARADVVRQAAHDREELIQLVRSLKSDDREQLHDINGTAKALFDRVRGLALALSQLDRTPQSNSAGAIDREIAQLEAQANPLDLNASEARVRRLAQLKRDRRGVADVQRRRAELEGKLESCALALQNLRFDVIRLKTGASSTQNVTLVADRAMSLARDVEAMISLNAEMARGSRPEPRR